MNFYRTFSRKSKHFLLLSSLMFVFLLTACGSADSNSSQVRNDLTSEHVRGLYSGMKRNAIEDMLGTSDRSLAEKESIEIYSLADGTTAVLRYREDTLMSAYLRDKDNVETPIFDLSQPNLPGVNGLNETNAIVPYPTDETVENPEEHETSDMISESDFPLETSEENKDDKMINP